MRAETSLVYRGHKLAGEIDAMKVSLKRLAQFAAAKLGRYASKPV